MLRGPVARMAKRQPFGLAIDIDGVVLRGKEVIPGAADAIGRLIRSKVPFLFLTNGGGILEGTKARELSNLLGLPVSADQVVLSHSPMRQWLLPRYADRKILLLGFGDYAEVATAYGFKRAVTPAQLIEADPDMFAFSAHGLGPAFRPSHGAPEDSSCLDPEVPFEAIVQLTDCVDWLPESQVVLDVLTGGHPLGMGVATNNGVADNVLSQAVPYYNSNLDWTFAGRYCAPRLAQGAFIECIEALWHKHSGGGKLKIEHCGKPFSITYQYAASMLARQLASSGNNVSQSDDDDENDALNPFTALYAIGDNPTADSRGANRAGAPWVSILVRTGIYGGDASALPREDAATIETADLSDAVDQVLAAHA